MTLAAITGHGVFTPSERIGNDELVQAFNAYADLWNVQNAQDIADGKTTPMSHSSSAFIESASGIKSRFVLNKSGILDSERMYPYLPARSDDDPGYMAQIGVSAARSALDMAQITPEQIDLVICAASNMERAYPAIAIEIQHLLGAGGFAFDMNVACSSATFGIQAAADMIRSGSVRRALVINPEICSAHLEWRDRDCHFIFGDVATATVLESADLAKGARFDVISTRCATEFSNNIRNNNGFLRRTHDQMQDRRDMQFMQNGRKVFKEVLPMVSAHILEHLGEAGWTPDDLCRLWLHQANKAMNDFIGKKVLGRVPQAAEQPNILQDYANTSSAGSIIAFSQNSADLTPGARGVICSFGAGYSVGSVLVERRG